MPPVAMMPHFTVKGVEEAMIFENVFVGCLKGEVL